VPGSPSSASNATSSWRFTASWLATTTVLARLRRRCQSGPAPPALALAEVARRPARHRRSPHRATTASRSVPVHSA
jgi:hypothetical protein